MKLSLERKLGHIHVRCGRVLRVAHAHQVPTKTANVNDPKEQTTRASAWETADVGDLAFELVAVKTDKVIGYSYLSGPAIRLHLYRETAPPHWFSEAIVRKVESDEHIWRALRAPTVDAFIEGVIAIKFAPCDLVVFSLTCENADAIRDAMDVWKKAYGYVPENMTDEEADRKGRPHLIAVVDTIKKKRGPMAVLHFEPPGCTSEAGCGGFQAPLVCAGPWPTFDPWAPPVPSAAVG